MNYFIWLVIGIALFLITWYVHTHTYTIEDFSYYSQKKVVEKVQVPLWVLLLAIIAMFIPILNLLAFIIGVIVYIVFIVEEEIEVRIEWLNKVIGFLNKKV